MKCEGMRMWWVIETDRDDCPIIPCRIRNQCTGSRSDPDRFQRGWLFDEYIVNAGRLSGGSEVVLSAVLEARDGSSVVLDAVTSLNPDATASLIDVTPAAGGQCTVRFSFKPRAGYQGVLYAMVAMDSPTGRGKVAVIAKVVP